MKSHTLSTLRRALARGNKVAVGWFLAPDGGTISEGKTFSDYPSLKACVKVNGFHGDCFVIRNEKKGQ